jgi:hypothetical protein
VYYPGVAAPADASVIAIGAGEERSDVDFQLRHVPALTVSGTLHGPDGPMPHTALDLLAAGAEYVARHDGFEAATTVTDASGAFTFLGVTPGQYVLRALRVPERPQRAISTGATTVIRMGNTTISSGIGGSVEPEVIPDEPTWSATMPVSVGNTDVSGLSVTMRSGGRIRGRVEFAGTAKAPPGDQIERMTLIVESSDGRPASAGNFQTRYVRPDAAGRLNSYQFAPGSYVLRPPAPVLAGWTFAGAMFDGRDVSVEPIEIAGTDIEIAVRFTDRPSELGGVIATDSRSTGAALLVVVFPADARGWIDYGPAPRRLQSSLHAGAGPFSFTGLPDGEYCVAVIPQDGVRDWRDPAFLKKLAPLASRVSVSEGEKPSVVLRPVTVR